MINNEWARRHNVGETALDVVWHLLRELRKYDGEQAGVELRSRSHRRNRFNASSAPEAPRGTEDYLSQFSEGT